MEAANQAKIDVAEAQMKGEKLRDGQTLQNNAAAKIDAGTKIVAEQGKKEEELKVTTDIVKVFDNQKEVALAKKAAQMAEVETRKAVAMREAQLEAQLQREVEKWNVLKRTEKLKADYVTKVQEANWELYQKQKAAESYLYQKQKEAEAAFYAKQKEAEGLVAIAEAEGTYVRTLLSAFGGNYTAFRDYTMIKKGKYQEVAFGGNEGGAIDDDGAMKRKLGCFRRCLKLCTSKLGCFRRRGSETNNKAPAAGN